MKKFLAFIVLMTAISVRAEVLSINQFSGLNTDGSPLTLQEGQTPDSQNVITDDGPGVKGRKGFVRYSTESAASGMWEFPLSNGTRYLITRSGSNLKATTNGSFTVLIGTVPTDRAIAGTVLGDRFYYSDTLNGIKYWNGTSVTVASAAMTLDKLVTWKGRLAGAGKSGSERVIFLSKYLDGTSWTLQTNPSDDDPAQITVTGALDENIQALYSSYQDKLMWLKKNSFGGLYGSRRSNFTNRTFSDRIGVASIETIQDCDGKLRWLGNNRKVYEFDGANFTSLSDEVDDIFNTVQQGDANSRSISYSATSDWVGGTFDPVVYADTITTNGSLSLTFPDPFTSLRDGQSVTKPVWTVYDDSFLSASLVSNGDNLVASIGTSDFSEILCLGSQEFFPSFGRGTTYYFDVKSLSSSRGTDHDFYLQLSSQVAISTNAYPYNPFMNAFKIQFEEATVNGGPGVDLRSWSNPVNGAISLATDPFAIPATIYVYFSTTDVNVSYSTGSGIVTIMYDNHSFPNASVISSLSFSNQSTTGNSLSISIDNFAVTPETMTYTSSVIDGGANISGFGSFITDDVNYDSDIGYKFATSTNSSSSLFLSTDYIAVANLNTPTNSVKRYLSFKSTFSIVASTIAASTATAVLNSVTINITEGSNIKASSAYIDQRYWIGCAISSTSNNRVLVYDKDGQWQRYTGYAPEVMCLYNSRLYVGSTNGIFLSESGYSDNGTAIDAYYTTKTQAPSNLDTYSKFTEMRITSDESSATLTPTFQIDENGTDNSLGSTGMNTRTGYQNLKFPFSTSNVQQGKFISLKLSVNGSSFWRILTGNLYYDRDMVPD